MTKHSERVEGREIVVVRRLAAKPSRVFAAWTRPEHLSRWFGPDGFSTETASFDLRPGGHWRFVMRHPEHGDFDNDIRFDVVEPARRLAYTHVDGHEELFSTLITFEPDGHGTRLTLRMTFATEEACRQSVEEVRAVEGGHQTLARLDALLGEDPGMALAIEPQGPADIVITRTFVASVQRVFDALTDPRQVERWLFTPRWPLSHCTIDLRVGGSFRYEWGDGRIGLGGTYLEIDAPHRTVHTELYDDDWTDGPAHVTTTLTQHGGTTELRMEIRYASPATRDRVLTTGMAESVDVNFDQLEALLGPRSAAA